MTVFSLVMQLDYRLLFEKHKASFLFHLIINYSDVCCWCYFIFYFLWSCFYYVMFSLLLMMMFVGFFVCFQRLFVLGFLFSFSFIIIFCLCLCLFVMHLFGFNSC